jgi:hypothetical protein
MTASAAESAFQQDIVRELVERGWALGSAAGYDRARALYTDDCLAFVKQANQMNQVLSNKNVAAGFGRVVFDLLVAQMKAGQVGQGPPSSQRR